MQKTYGLIGKNISYSFSKTYFTQKFSKEGIDNARYLNFDIQSIQHFKKTLAAYPNLKGLNVTIPYKETIIPHLDKVSKKAKKIGAVNTIRISKKGKLKGYNTDAYGFKKSIQPVLKSQHQKALILGTGGASKAIAYTLKKLAIKYQFVSRSNDNHLSYHSLTPAIINEHQIIINCTPLGTHPNVNECPDIPYDTLSKNHILYDLVYNPKETLFLKKGAKKGAKTINGEQMLILQAKKSWEIWNK